MTRDGAAQALLLLAALLLVAPSSPAAEERRGPMNIILILSDDVGAETVGVYGGESYQTPELDRLAAQGMRFEHGHAQPLCTPSRVKLMTGQYNFRNYRHFGYLDPDSRTFAHLLRGAGYSTTVVGKWQLFDNVFEDIRGAMPADAGFDDFLLWQLKNWNKGSRYWGPRLNHNGEVKQYEQTVFGPDVFNDYVLDYIERHRSGPFLLYYPMVLAHDPWVTTPDMRDASASDPDKFAAMIAYMDKLVGKVRRKVEALGIADRTVIFFIGDNGTGREIVSRHRGRDVRGAKGRTLEAGTRVPFIAWGPGVVEPGGVSGSLVNLNDILPTLAELAGVALTAEYQADGVSLVPVLRGAAELERKNLFVHYEPMWPTGRPARYAFDRRWKLYQDGDFFDTKADPLEQSPLDTGTLDAEAGAAHRALAARIQGMPGQLRSTGRWLPKQFYLALAVAALVFAILVISLWRLARSVIGRRAERKDR